MALLLLLWGDYCISLLGLFCTPTGREREAVFTQTWSFSFKRVDEDYGYVRSKEELHEIGSFMVGPNFGDGLRNVKK